MEIVTEWLEEPVVPLDLQTVYSIGETTVTEYDVDLERELVTSVDIYVFSIVRE